MKTRRWGFFFLLAGLALCSVGIWQLVQPARYRATAQVEVAKYGEGNCFDGFPDTEFEVIRSQYVLGRVIELMDLNIKLGRKLGKTTPFQTSETMRLLNRDLNLSLTNNTQFYLINVRFESADPNEAAKIANFVGKAYIDHRLAQTRERTLRGIKSLEARLSGEDIKIQRIQKEFDELQNRATDHKSVEEKKEELDDLLKFRKAISQKIESEKTETEPRTLLQMVTTASPPSDPVSPNCRLSAVILLGGLALFGFGTLTLLRTPKVLPI